MVFLMNASDGASEEVGPFLLAEQERLAVIVADQVGRFDDFVRVALFDEEFLTFEEELDVGRVLRHQTVEIAVKMTVVGLFGALEAQDATEPLSLLTARSGVKRDLDEHVGVGQVDRSVGDFAEQERVAVRIAAEVVEGLDALLLGRVAADVGPIERLGVVLERENVVREDDDLVVAAFVPANEELTGAELLGIHGRDAVLDRLAAQIGLREFFVHGTLDEIALDAGDVPVAHQFGPVGLVQFRSDQEVEVFDFVVLAHQRGRQTQFAVRVHRAEHRAEHARRHRVHLVQDHDPPLLITQPVHHLLTFDRTFALVGDHFERAQHDAAPARLDHLQVFAGRRRR